MRSLILGNGFEINFNPNMQYGRIVDLIVNHKEDFIKFLNRFLKENIFFDFYLKLFQIKNEEIYDLIVKNIIFYDNTKSIEDNLNQIFDNSNIFFQHIKKDIFEKKDISKIFNDFLEINNEKDLVWWENFSFLSEKKSWKFFSPYAELFSSLKKDENNSKFEDRNKIKYIQSFNIFNFFSIFFITKMLKKNEFEIIKERSKDERSFYKNRDELNELNKLDNFWFKLQWMLKNRKISNIDEILFKWLPIESFFRDKFIEKLIKEFFCFYIKTEFCKTEITMSIFFKLFPNAKIFLESYDQIITTNYNDYSFLNQNTINIHGKIGNQKNSIIWFESEKEKQNWKKISIEREINIKNYNQIDIMGLSLKNDENTIIDIINNSNSDDLIINYYAFDEKDKNYFTKVIQKLIKKYEIKLINKRKELDFDLDDNLFFPIKFQKQGYVFGLETRKFVQIFIKDINEFWGFSREIIKKFWVFKNIMLENNKRFIISFREQISLILSEKSDLLEKNKEKIINKISELKFDADWFASDVTINNSYSEAYFFQKILSPLKDIFSSLKEEKTKQDDSKNLAINDGEIVDVNSSIKDNNKDIDQSN